jgi:hypothetical protein
MLRSAYRKYGLILLSSLLSTVCERVFRSSDAGHLDRVVHGITAEEILDACDEKMDASAGERLSNPTISIAQAVRRHNLATFRHMANQQIKRAQEALDPKMTRTMHPSLVQRVQSAEPFMVQGLRANTRDPDSHVVYFDIEALIGMVVIKYSCICSTDYILEFKCTKNSVVTGMMTIIAVTLIVPLMPVL